MEDVILLLLITGLNYLRFTDSPVFIFTQQVLNELYLFVNEKTGNVNSNHHRRVNVFKCKIVTKRCKKLKNFPPPAVEAQQEV